MQSGPVREERTGRTTMTALHTLGRCGGRVCLPDLTPGYSNFTLNHHFSV